MGLLGSILALPVKLANVPLRVAEYIMSGGDVREDDRIISMPLNKLAEEIEKVDDSARRAGGAK